MDESLQDLPTLFVDKMIKYWMFKYVNVVSKLSNVVKLNKESYDMESILIAIKKGKTNYSSQEVVTYHKKVGKGILPLKPNLIILLNVTKGLIIQNQC